MTRIMVGMSLGLMSMLLAASGCSSEAVDDDDDEKGGSGAIISGGSGGSTSGGSSTGGTSSGCAGTEVTCVDAATAEACNPETGKVETANCAEELGKEGLISNGCTSDAEGTGCTLDGFADQGCADGMVPFAVCGQLSEDQLLNVYINCFLDTSGLHAIIPCFADYVDEAAKTVDCVAAEMACIPADFMP